LSGAVRFRAAPRIEHIVGAHNAAHSIFFTAAAYQWFDLLFANDVNEQVVFLVCYDLVWFAFITFRKIHFYNAL
jgi:hypothetical protein